jgi:hypothetical protein
LLLALLPVLPSRGMAPRDPDSLSVLKESFETNSAPSGWSVSGSPGWAFDNPAGRTNNTSGSGGFAIADSDNSFDAMDTELRTPALDLSAYSQVRLQFNTDYKDMSSQDEYAGVDVSTNGGTSWISAWRKANADYQGPVSLNLDALAGGKSNVVIRFHYAGATRAWFWQVDDVEVTGMAAPAPTSTPLPTTPTAVPAPAAPTGLAASGQTQKTISLSWSAVEGGVLGYKVERLADGVSGWRELGGVKAGTTSFQDSGLGCGGAYSYRVRAYGAGGNSGYSSVLAAGTAACGAGPSAPTGLAGSASGPAQIRLGWTDSSADEDGFKVERSADSGATWPRMMTTGPNVEVLGDSGLGCNKTYRYRLSAFNASGSSAGGEVDVTTAACPGATEGLSEAFESGATPSGWTVIGSPGWRFDNPAGRVNETGGEGAFASADSDYAAASMDTELRSPVLDLSGKPTVGLEFRSASISGGTVEVDVSQDGGTNWSNVWPKSGGGDRIVRLDLSSAMGGKSNVQLRFHFVAAVSSPYWEVDSVNLTALASETAPAAPSGLALAGALESSISLKWADNSSNETGFRLERSGDGGTTWDLAGESGPNVHALTDTGLVCAASYAYRVRAFNLTGESTTTGLSSASTGACSDSPAAPSGLAAQAVSESAIDLSWQDNSSSETGFIIEASESITEVNWVQVGTADENATTFQRSGLRCTEMLYFRVYAVNGAGRSAASPTASAATAACAAPSAPKDLAASEVRDTTLRLAWSDGGGKETSFKVERSPDGSAWRQVGTTGVNINQYSDGGLACNTSYSYRVRASRAGVGDSEYSSVLRLRTQGCTLLNEGFSGGSLPAGWQALESNSAAGKPGWLFNDPGGYGNRTGGSGGFASADRYQAGLLNQWQMNAELRTPALNFSTYSAITLTYRLDFEADSTSVGLIEASLDGGTTWQGGHEWSWSLKTGADDTQELDLSAYAGQPSVMLRFYYKNAENGRFQLDDVKVAAGTQEGTAPAALSGLARTGGSEDSIAMSWSAPNSPPAGAIVERSLDGTNWLVVERTGLGVATFTDRGLDCGVAYQYRLRAANLAGVSGYGSAVGMASAGCSAPPSAPGTLSKIAAGPTRVALKWAQGSGARASIEVERSQGETGWQEIASLGGKETTFTDQGLACKTAYRYRLRAVNAGGASEYSDELRVSTDDCPAAPVPAAPTNLTSPGQTATTIRLAWTDNSSNEAGFRIERSADNRSWAQVGVTGASITTFTDQGLACGVPYAYRVAAFSAGGGSAASAVLTTQAAACPSSKPAAPSGLAVSSRTINRITLSWNDHSDNEDGFQIERSPNGATDWSPLTTVGANVTRFTNEGLGCGRKYSYRVRAYNRASGQSAWSNELQAGTEACPAAPAFCSTPAGSSFTLLDTKADPAANRYRVLMEIKVGGITNLSASGCDVVGTMHLVLHNNDVSGIPVEGNVTQYNEFESTKIGHFSLLIAGLRFYTGVPWPDGMTVPGAFYGKLPVFYNGKLRMNAAHLAAPKELGGAYVALLTQPQISKDGLQWHANPLNSAAGALKLPVMKILGIVQDNVKKIKELPIPIFYLNGDLVFTSRGFEIIAEGQVRFPAAQVTAGCSDLSANARIYINEKTGQTMMEYATPDDQALPFVAEGLEPSGVDALANLGPQPAALHSPEGETPGLPNGPDGFPDWRQVGGKLGLKVQCSPGIPLGPQPVIFLSGMRGEVAIGMQGTGFKIGATISVTNFGLVTVEGDTEFQFLPELKARVTAAVKVLFVLKFASADVSLSESQGLWIKGEARQPGFPLVKYQVSLHGWVSGIQPMGLLGPLAWKFMSPRFPPAKPRFHLTGQAKAYLGIEKGEITRALEDLVGTKIRIPSPCLLDWCDYSIGLRGWLGDLLNKLGLPSSITIKIPCGVNRKYLHGYYPLTLNKPSWYKLRFGYCYENSRAQIPYVPVIGPCWWWQVSQRQSVTWVIPVPNFKKGSFENCSVEPVLVPDQDWKAYEQNGEVGEFYRRNGSQISKWGFQAYIKLLSLQFGYFANFTDKKMEWTNQRAYRLIDGTMVQRALRQRQGLADEDALQAQVSPEVVNSVNLGDDGALVIQTPNTGLDSLGQPLAAAGLQNAITSTNVITRTDTLFEVGSRVPLVLSLITPRGVEITPENYASNPDGYTVRYTQVYTYQPENAHDTQKGRWRLFNTSADTNAMTLTLKLDGAPFATDVSVGTTYTDVVSGTHTLGVMLRDGSEISATFHAAAKDDVTVMLVGVNRGDLVALADDNTAPAELGQGRLRIFNALPEVEAVDVLLDGVEWTNGLAYKSASGYLTLAAGEHTLELRSAGTQDTIVSGPLHIWQGAVYTVVAQPLQLNGGALLFLAQAEDQSWLGANIAGMLAPLAASTSSFSTLGENLDEHYVPITTTAYGVDQADVGKWQVKLTGAVTQTGWVLSVSGIMNPPIVSEFNVQSSGLAPDTVDASLTVRSDQQPTVLRFYANPDAITETLTITDSQGVPHTSEIPMYQGQILDVITLTERSQVDGSLKLTYPLTVSNIESGSYHVYVEVEDGINPPVNVYAAVGSGIQAAQAAPEVNVAAEGYDPLEALETAGVVTLDRRASFTDDLMASVTITPELNVPSYEWDPATQAWVVSGRSPLRVKWAPVYHPDAEYQELLVETPLEGDVYTTTYAESFDFEAIPVTNTLGEVVSEYQQANIPGVDAGKSYRIKIGLRDNQTDTFIWSKPVSVTIPTGSFGLAESPVRSSRAAPLKMEFLPGEGYGVVRTSLALTSTSDLFYTPSLDFNLDDLPEGIDAEVLLDRDPLLGESLAAVPAAPEAVNSQAIPIAIHADEEVPDGTYTLPVVAEAGEEEHTVNLVFTVQHPNYEVSLSNAADQGGKPGDQLTYTYALTNTGALTDTYHVYLDNLDGWPVEISGSAGSWEATWEQMVIKDVAPGQKVTLTVKITIPADVYTQRRSFNLIAESSFSENIYAAGSGVAAVTRISRIYAPFVCRKK